MFGADFGEKCIIVHFLGPEKDKKRPERRDAEVLRKDLRKIRDGKTSREKERSTLDALVPQAPGLTAPGRITCGRLCNLELSPLFAHTSARDYALDTRFVP
jgi:hypothetical protein